MSPHEQAARAAGWAPRDSHFTRSGVSIAYVGWEALCARERIPVDPIVKERESAHKKRARS